MSESVAKPYTILSCLNDNFFTLVIFTYCACKKYHFKINLGNSLFLSPNGLLSLKMP